MSHMSKMFWPVVFQTQERHEKMWKDGFDGEIRGEHMANRDREAARREDRQDRPFWPQLFLNALGLLTGLVAVL